MYIETIGSPKDLKTLGAEELSALAGEIREAIINKVSACGGHLGSNLGVVELTIALHYVFDAPTDKIVFDVSHQTYCHKILTGRKDAFLCEDKYKTVTGFSNPCESEYDLFTIGHTSTSVSLACGLAKARDLMGGRENVVAIIGDASLDGGEAFEALNYAAELNSGLIVVINDNEMSIPENHGALGRHLTELRKSHGNCSDNFFRSIGFEYHLIENGNDIPALIAGLSKIKGTHRPVAVHVCTQKGKGFAFAEENKEKWHWARPFDRDTGEFLSSVPKENYGSIISEHLLDLMSRDPKLAVIAASTPICIGFDSEKRNRAGKQYIDVGIAEQNAVTMAAAMAKGGCRPVFATNSTFIQRAYDQIEQEMCIDKCPATMIVTHASVFGHFNDTHTGVYDIPLLGNIPGLTYLAPSNKEEYISMLDWSVSQNNVPVAIRVPWTGVTHADYDIPDDYSKTAYKTVLKGEKVCFIALGGFFELGRRAAGLLTEKTGIQPTLIDPMFISGVDEETLDSLYAEHEIVVTLEDGILDGGFGSRIAGYYSDKSMKVLRFGFSGKIPRVYVPAELMQQNQLTEQQIVDRVLELL